MAEQIREMSEQLKKSANADSKTNQQAAEELQNQLDALKKEKQRHNEEAMQPLERMAQVLPLKQAEGEFTQLVQRQRELADRLQSLQDANASSDAATRARMRELEEEQNRIREQLKDLLDRIEEHAESLPDDPELSDLKSTALEFAAAVREAQPENEMASAEQQLNEFNGHQGFEHAQEAARILEQFLSQCNGMGQQAEGACKAKFSPGMGQCMSNSLSQLAPGFGQKSGGMGMGPGGSGGSSSQMSNSQNVGMYGGMPMMDQSLSGMSDSNSDSNGGVFSDPFANGSDENSSGLTGRQTNPAFGGGAWGVPVQYRRQAGRYLQQLADDLDEE